MWIPLDSLFEYRVPAPGELGITPLKRKTRDRSPKGGRQIKSKARQVPATMSHCVLAVRKKGKDTKDAWHICRSQLTKRGFLKGPYKTSTEIPKSVRQTSKGSRRSMKHAMEKDAPKKFRQFKDAFRSLGN